MRRVCVVLPVYNEEIYLAPLIAKIKGYGFDVVVVDDGSRDKSAVIAESHGAFVIMHPSNEGKGAALRDGLQFAAKRDYDYIITIDADGQHNPDEIGEFIAKIEDSDAAIIVGNRLHNPKGMPPRRLFVNRFFSRIVSRVTNQLIPDVLCGYRIMRLEVIQSIELCSRHYDIDPEILIKAAKANFKISFLDIESIYSGERSYIRPLIDGYRFFRLILTEVKDARTTGNNK